MRLAKFRSEPWIFHHGGLATLFPPSETVMLNGRVYTIDLEKYRRSSQDTLRPTYGTSAQTDDSLFNASGAWSRYKVSWHHGGDLEFADMQPDVDPFRFRSSRGVDVWTEHELKLLHFGRVRAGSLGTGCVACSIGEYAYVGGGTTLRRNSTAGDISTLTSISSPGGTIQAIASDGVDAYVATTSGLSKVANAVGGGSAITAFSTPVTGNCTNVAFVANRLLLARSNILYEVGATGTLTTIKTHFQPSFRWTTMFSIGSRIYIGGYAGARSELYSVATDSTGAIVQAAEAAPLPTGELLQNAYAYAGSVLLLTSNGVRLATTGADGTLSYGPLIDDVGSVNCAIADGRFVWVPWSDYPDGGIGLARLALDTFVAPLQPAYAADVYTDELADDPVVCIGRIGGSVFFVTTSGKLVHEDLNYYARSGSITSGLLTMGTVEPKGLASLAVRSSALTIGQRVVGTITASTGEQLGQIAMSTEAQTDGDVNLAGVRMTEAEVTIELSGTYTSGNGPTSTPTISMWRLRGYPIPPQVDQWIVPIRLHRHTLAGSGVAHTHHYVPLDEAERLIDWCRTKEAVVYVEGDRSYPVRIDAYELSDARWHDDGRFFDHILTLRLVRIT